ncbi:MAG: hypothetical protein IT371_12180 [Deltaproteobacteria bacterium]|nr:hypothetical protein [Deltaproteobacteria bacterium]
MHPAISLSPATAPGCRPRWWGTFVAGLGLLAALGFPAAATADRVAARSITHRVTERADATQAASELLVRTGWGRGAGQLGRDPDGAGLGPAALAFGPRGELLVLDAANRRVLVLSPRGRPERALPLPGGHPRDLVALGAHLFVLAHASGAPDRYEVHALDLTTGQLRRTLPVPAAARVPGALLVAGSPAAPDLWIEADPLRCVPLLRAGAPVPATAQLRPVLGRPTRSSRRPLVAALTGRTDLTVGELDERGHVRPLADLQSAHPITAIREVTTDAAGRLFVVIVVARGPDPETAGLRQVLVVLDGRSAPRQLELAPPTALEPARPVAVAPDGAVVQLHVTPDGVTLRRFSAAAREASRP